MPDPQFIINAVRDLGLIAVIILASMWGIWKVIVPAIITQQRTQMTYYIDEIKSLRQESREDKQKMFDAFNRNSEINAKLQMALDAISAQIHELTKDVISLKEEIRHMSEKGDNNYE